jgi:hypothetical protein
LPINQKKEDWNLRDIEAKMRKGVRKEVPAASMGEELAVFYSMQKGVAFRKLIILLGVTLVIFCITSIESSVLFSFILFISTELLCASSIASSIKFYLSLIPL